MISLALSFALLMTSSVSAEDFGLNDRAVQIATSDTVPRIDTTLYQRLGPVCPQYTERVSVINGQRVRINDDWAIDWQNKGVRPWQQSNWPQNMTREQLMKVACRIALTNASLMQNSTQKRGLGGNMERLAEFEGMTAARIKANTNARMYGDALRAWEMANLTYAVARAMGVSVKK